MFRDFGVDIGAMTLCLDDEGNNSWPEVLKFMFDCISSDNTNLKEAALHIFWYGFFLEFIDFISGV